MQFLIFNENQNANEIKRDSNVKLIWKNEREKGFPVKCF
jgi:hypothetical protein